MVGAEVLGDENRPWGKERLLARLLTHDVVTLVRYSDTGPPDGSTHVTDDFVGNSRLIDHRAPLASIVINVEKNRVQPYY